MEFKQEILDEVVDEPGTWRHNANSTGDYYVDPASGALHYDVKEMNGGPLVGGEADYGFCEGDDNSLENDDDDDDDDDNAEMILGDIPDSVPSVCRLETDVGDSHPKTQSSATNPPTALQQKPSQKELGHDRGDSASSIAVNNNNNNINNNNVSNQSTKGTLSGPDQASSPLTGAQPSSGAQRLACSKCPLIFSKPDFLKKHMDRLHPVVGPFRCPDCAFETKFPSILQLHLREPHPTAPRRERKSLVTPRRGTRLRLQCTCCDFEATTVTQLNSHTRTLHADARKTNKRINTKQTYRKGVYRCSVAVASCDFEARDWNALEKHCFVKHNRRARLCPKCEFFSVCKDSFTKHVRAHGNHPPIVCEDCGRVFPLKANLVRHRSVNHANRVDTLPATNGAANASATPVGTSAIFSSRQCESVASSGALASPAVTDQTISTGSSPRSSVAQSGGKVQPASFTFNPCLTTPTNPIRSAQTPARSVTKRTKTSVSSVGRGQHDGLFQQSLVSPHTAVAATSTVTTTTSAATSATSAPLSSAVAISCTAVTITPIGSALYTAPASSQGSSLSSSVYTTQSSGTNGTTLSSPGPSRYIATAMNGTETNRGSLGGRHRPSSFGSNDASLPEPCHHHHRRHHHHPPSEAFEISLLPRGAATHRPRSVPQPISRSESRKSVNGRTDGDRASVSKRQQTSSLGITLPSSMTIVWNPLFDLNTDTTCSVALDANRAHSESANSYASAGTNKLDQRSGVIIEPIRADARDQGLMFKENCTARRIAASHQTDTRPLCITAAMNGDRAPKSDYFAVSSARDPGSAVELEIFSDRELTPPPLVIDDGPMSD